MEEIFYAVLALHTAGKLINKENIQAVLRKAGTQVDERALDAMAAFVESLATAHQGKKSTIDPRIIKFLTSELAEQKVPTKRLDVLLDKLSKAAASVPGTQNARFRGMTTAVEEARPAAQRSMAGKRVITPGAKPAAESLAPKHDVSTRGEGRYVYGVAAWGREPGLKQ